MTHQTNAQNKQLKEILPLVCFFIISFLGGFGFTNSYAANLDAKLYSETTYNSNVRLATTNTEDDVIERIGINVLLTEERKRFTADASFNLSQEYYLKNTFSDQTQLSTGFGLFNFDIVEDFLDWRTSFLRSEVLSDATAVDTPDNREARNTFTTGPTINYRINQVSTFRSGANFVQVDNSDKDAADTKRVSGNASYIYQYNSITDFSLNGTYSQIIETEQNGISPLTDDKIKNISLNVGMSRQFSHGSFSINAGQNQVLSDTEDTIKGDFYNIQFQREQVFYHNLNIQYSESISDSSIGFQTEELITSASPGSPTGSSQLETATQLDILKQKSLNVSVNRGIDSSQYGLSAFWSSLSYEKQQSDERSVGFNLNLSEKIQEGLIVGFSYQYVKQEFPGRPSLGDNATQTYSLDTGYNWTKDFSSQGSISYERRGNSKNALQEYENFSVGVTFTFDLY